MPLTFSLNETQSRLHAYWRRKRAGRPMPFECDFDPSDVPGALPFTVMLEATAGRLRYRRMGSAVTEAFGSAPIGGFVDEQLPAARFTTAAHSYEMALENARPVMSCSNFTTPHGEQLRIVRLILPVTDDGVRISQLAACLALPPAREMHRIVNDTVLPDSPEFTLL